jgi:hypothetical protein
LGILKGSNVDLRLYKHPEKTFIGRIERGFDFLGYHFSPKGLAAAKETLRRFVSRATRLYEQDHGPCKLSDICRVLTERRFKRGTDKEPGRKAEPESPGDRPWMDKKRQGHC